jgi:hypothetical protein
VIFYTSASGIRAFDGRNTVSGRRKSVIMLAGQKTERASKTPPLA